MGAHYSSSLYYIDNICISYPRPLSPSAATICLLFNRIAIVSRYSLVYQPLPCHIRLSSSSPLTHPVPCIFNVLLLCESYFILFCLSIVVPHGHILVATSSSSQLLVYLFLLSGGSRPLHEIAVSAVSRSPLCRADRYVSFQYLPSTPRSSLSACSISHLFLALAFPFFYFFLSCTRQTSL